MEVLFGEAFYPATVDVVMLAAFDQDGTKKIESIGTAFPCLIDGIVFIITAAHVLRLAEGKVLMGMLRGAAELKNAEILINDEMDIGVIIADDTVLADIFDGSCHCLPPSDNKRSNVFLQAVGYPSSKNKIVKGRPINRNAFNVTLGKHVDGLNINSSLLIDNRLTITRSLHPEKLVDDIGQRVDSLGKFNGMSGGPIVEFAPDKFGQTAVGRLAGMFLEWHRAEAACVGLRWRFIDAWIRVQVLPRYLPNYTPPTWALRLAGL